MLPLKNRFALPEDLIYLDGNSLGPLPLGAMERARAVMENQWGGDLIRAWNKADWITLPKRVGDRLAGLIGAPAGSIATGDTLSIKVYQALAAALALRPDRRVILSDSGNFPTDLYMAQGLVKTLDRGHELKTPSPEDLLSQLDEDVAVVMLTHVDYRTGRLHDMAAITAAAHAVGALVIWDLAHSIGALPLDLTSCEADFAVGCTYKFLNGGPGAPAFIYVRPDWAEAVEPALAGWMGHAAPFEMNTDYRPAPSTERLRVGTPPIIQLSVLDAALDVWEDVDLNQLRQASIDLGDLFIREVESRCPSLSLASPRDGKARGSQVSFTSEDSYAVVQALADLNVIGDFRAPNIMRFGITPLYLEPDDIVKAAEVLERVMQQELWRNPKYQIRSAVT